MFSPLTKQLIEALRALPGVGPKSAQRMAFHLLKQDVKSQGMLLANALQEALTHVGHCKRCRNYTEQEICQLCRSPKRQTNLLCVVENPADVAAIELTSMYNGLYFVLHGHLSPLDGIGPNEVGIPALLEQVTREAITELIIATNPTMEGKATAHYIATHVDRSKTRCSRIAHGVPIGGELEYLDGGTLSHALQSRLPMEGI